MKKIIIIGIILLTTGCSAINDDDIVQAFQVNQQNWQLAETEAKTVRARLAALEKQIGLEVGDEK